MTKFLALETAKGIQNIQVDRNPHVSDYVFYIDNTLTLHLSWNFLFLAVNKWPAPDYCFAGIESAVWTGGYWTASQIIQLGDCTALCGRRDLNEDIPLSQASHCLHCAN